VVEGGRQIRTPLSPQGLGPSSHPKPMLHAPWALWQRVNFVAPLSSWLVREREQLSPQQQRALPWLRDFWSASSDCVLAAGLPALLLLSPPVCGGKSPSYVCRPLDLCLTSHTEDMLFPCRVSNAPVPRPSRSPPLPPNPSPRTGEQPVKRLAVTRPYCSELAKRRHGCHCRRSLPSPFPRLPDGYNCKTP